MIIIIIAIDHENVLESWIPKNMLGLTGAPANLVSACTKNGALGPLVWEEIENGQTVLKG
jgi:hypothetical protein